MRVVDFGDMRASATSKVASKSLYVRQGTAFAMNEAAKVSRRPEITNITLIGISVEFERVCNAVHVRSVEPPRQATKRLGRAKVVFYD